MTDISSCQALEILYKAKVTAENLSDILNDNDDTTALEDLLWLRDYELYLDQSKTVLSLRTE